MLHRGSFISMLEEYFLGHSELFTGLALETQETELAKLQKRDAWIDAKNYAVKQY